MKKCIEILDFEDKTTNAGKPYVRFKTSEGWMSCFDGKSNEELKKLKGNSANCEVIESGEFKNIKKFHGPASETPDTTPEKVPQETKGSRFHSNGKKEMYISYAKDVFCAVCSRISQSEFDGMSEEERLELAELAIKVIKKIEKAF